MWNIFSIRALIKGLMGKSLTFSLVFAMAVLGFSFGGTMRESLRFVGLWTPLVWLLPLIVTGLLAKNEKRLNLKPGFQRTMAYLLIFGSIALGIGLWKWGSWHREHYEQSIILGPKFQEIDNKEPVRRRFGPKR